MVTARRKEKEKELRRNEIIDAAEKLFFKKGYEGVSMDDVAKETQLAKGTLYLYFKNKESLFFAVVLRATRIMNAMFKEGVEKAETGADKLRSTGVSYYEFYKQYPDYFRLFTYAQSPCFTGGEEGAAEVSRLGRESVELMYESIRLGQADGSIRKDIDPIKTAWFLIFASESVINHSAELKAALESQGVSQDEFVEYSLGLMADGIMAKRRRK
jgi:TetR/AcrR family transcriptional regulator